MDNPGNVNLHANWEVVQSDVTPLTTIFTAGIVLVHCRMMTMVDLLLAFLQWHNDGRVLFSDAMTGILKSCNIVRISMKENCCEDCS